MCIRDRINSAAAAPRPRKAGMWHLALIHCATKMTVNSEVMAKSMPVEMCIRDRLRPE